MSSQIIICMLASVLFGMVLATIINATFFMRLKEIAEENRENEKKEEDNNEELIS